MSLKAMKVTFVCLFVRNRMEAAVVSEGGLHNTSGIERSCETLPGSPVGHQREQRRERSHVGAVLRLL